MLRKAPALIAPLLALAGTLTPLAPAAAAERTHRETLRDRYELPAAAGRRFLLIDNVEGSVEVRAVADAGDRVEVVIEQSFRAASEADLAEARRETRLTVEREPGRLALVQDGPFRCDRADNRHLCRATREDRDWEATFDWVVTVPATLDLEVRTVNGGRLAIAGVTGRIEAANVNGGIELEEVAGEVAAASVNGGIAASFARLPSGDLSFATVNGEIDLAFPAGFGAELSTQTLNGEVWTDFEFETSAPRRVAERRGGRHRLDGAAIRIGGGGPALSCKTVNGDILIRAKG